LFRVQAGDCWELGRQSYINGDHYHTVLWMGEALNKLEEESNKTAARKDILEYLAFSTYKQGKSASLSGSAEKMERKFQRSVSRV
jgi:prolyl 4-hydroxylase